ncbi:MAG: cytochrome P450 [Candidatus Methylomirabilales bacterium]
MFPPGPRLPAGVQTLLWVMCPTRLLEWCLRHYGDPFSLRLAHAQHLVVLADPAAIKAVFTGDPGLLLGGKGNAILEPVVGPHSVLLLDGPAHLRQRRLLLPPFHGEQLQRYGDRIAEIARRQLDSWPVGVPVALRPRLQAITLEVIIRLVFGIEEAARLERLRVLLQRVLDLAASRTMAFLLLWLPRPRVRRRWGPWARFQRAIDGVDAALFEELGRRRRAASASDRDSVLSLLLRARDEHGNPMTDAELRDELMTLLVAGHETTATALAWAFERLLRAPRSLARVQHELAEGGGAYLDAVLKEVLRLRPIVPIVVRRLAAPMLVQGYVLPAGAHVAPCSYLVHRRPDVYPDPLAFRPERFLEAPPDPYAWIPFGGGSRRCLGGSFAMYEMKVVLSTVLGRAELRPAVQAAEPIRRRGLTFAPGREALVVVAERTPSR